MFQRCFIHIQKSEGFHIVYIPGEGCVLKKLPELFLLFPDPFFLQDSVKCQSDSISELFKKADQLRSKLIGPVIIKLQQSYNIFSGSERNECDGLVSILYAAVRTYPKKLRNGYRSWSA